MDYCPPCRRHLNGALSCPGCGKPVEELELPRAGSGAAARAGAAGADDASDAPMTRAERRRAQKTPSAASRRKPKSRGVVRGGRARRARPGRGRRRIVVAAVLGPVLAALFVAELANEGYFRESAPAPAREKPVADHGGGVTESAEPVARDSGGPSTAASTGSGRPDGDTEDRDHKKGEDGKKAKHASSSAPGTPVSGAPDPSAPATGGAGTTQPSPPSQPRPTTPGTSAPTPTPTPSETCNRFLWWCT
ncbi:hypothetical protein [Streptomyces sp. NPDC048636]|uniref:SCO2400 family protein n=1 Tax=Streptomyces sp. NPDC048636 TaxID=3155762 RepID=UPI0034361D2E